MRCITDLLPSKKNIAMYRIMMEDIIIADDAYTKL